MALHSIVESSSKGDIDCNDFVELCSQTLVQLEEEEYIYQYIQAHA